MQPYLQPLSPKYRFADMYRRGRAAAIDESRFPLLAAHVLRCGFLPNIASDTPARRHKDAQPTLRRLRLLAEKYGALTMLTLDLTHLDGFDLYARSLAREAHDAVRILLQTFNLVGTWVIERGRDGHTHAHVVTSASLPTIVGGRKSEVYHLERLAAYLVKPSNACLVRVRPKDFSRWTPVELTEMNHCAAEEYLVARSLVGEGKRLPHLRSDNVRSGHSALQDIELRTEAAFPVPKRARGCTCT